MPSNIIDVQDLVQVYGDGTKAVQGISFKVEEEQFFGFLGPNGAGKSTTIKVLTTLLQKTSGKVSVAGYDLDTHPQAIRRVIGVQSQETVVDIDLTGRENMMLEGHLQQMHGQELKDRVEELLGLVELSDVADRRAGNYSGGMKKRLDLASALVHRPKLLFLDEPTTGLDPQSRAAIWKYLSRLNKEEGITIFLTTQYMEEADRLCRELYIVDHGQIVANGSPSALKSEIGADSIKLSLENGRSKEELNESAKKILGAVAGIISVSVSDDGVTAFAKNAGMIVADIVRAFDSNAIRLSSISISSPTLDDIFLQHTGRRIRPEELSSRPTTMRRFGARRPARE